MLEYFFANLQKIPKKRRQNSRKNLDFQHYNFRKTWNGANGTISALTKLSNYLNPSKYEQKLQPMSAIIQYGKYHTQLVPELKKTYGRKSKLKTRH